MEPLTDDERRSVALYLGTSRNISSVWWHYVAWIGPSLAIFAYGALSADVIGMAVAYCALLAMSVWYLADSHRQGKHLLTALEKYEAACNAIAQKQVGG